MKNNERSTLEQEFRIPNHILDVPMLQIWKQEIHMSEEDPWPPDSAAKSVITCRLLAQTMFKGKLPWEIWHVYSEEEPEPSGPGMNIAPAVYLTFIVEGGQVLFMFEAGTAVTSLRRYKGLQHLRSGAISGTSWSETVVQYI